MDLDVLDGARRLLLTPERVDQPVDRHDLVPVQEEHREDELLLPAAELERVALVVVDLERAEQPEVHPPMFPRDSARMQPRAAALQSPRNRPERTSLPSTAHDGRDEGEDMNARNAQILRRLACTAVAAALALPAAAVAGGRDDATLQNDIAHYGVPASSGDGSGATLRNDQAHFGPKASASAAVPREAPAAIVVSVDGGFDWISAAVGAAGGFGLALVAAAFHPPAARRRRRPGVSWPARKAPDGAFLASLGEWRAVRACAPLTTGTGSPNCMGATCTGYAVVDFRLTKLRRWAPALRRTCRLSAPPRSGTGDDLGILRVLAVFVSSRVSRPGLHVTVRVFSDQWAVLGSNQRPWD